MTNAPDYSAFIGHNRPDDLSEIAKLAEAQLAAQLKVDKLEADLKLANEELRELAEKQIPEKMDILGLSTYSTTTGIHVKVEEKVRASLAVENRPKAYDWLEKHGFGGMIKSNVVVNYKRDEIEAANKFVDQLRKESRVANLERKVEPATLTAFIKEQLAQGVDIPLDVFSVFRQRIARVEV